MRVVLQRVRRASVTVNGRVVGAIEEGFLALVGAGEGDTEEDARYLAHKVARLRVFADEADKMNRSLLDTGGSLLAVSQFTLYGDCRKGLRPSFGTALEPVAARALFDLFVEESRRAGVGRVECGEFGAMMDVELLNDGPVTLLLDSRKAF